MISKIKILDPEIKRKIIGKMPEIRFTVTKKLNELILDVSNNLGVDKSDYVRSLILTDLKKNMEKNDEK